MVEIAEGIFVETEYQGVNVGAIITDEGVVCIDVPSYPRDARDWAVRIERLHPRPIRFVILTDGNGDRILNTRWLNAPIVAQQKVADRFQSYEKRYPFPMIESLINRDPKQGKELANGPVDQVSISFSSDMTITSFGNVINLISRPGPTSGNIWVEVPHRRILFSGDSIVNRTQPILEELELLEWIDTLESMSVLQEHFDVLVPGRGEITDLSAINDMSIYLIKLKTMLISYLNDGLARHELNKIVDQLLGDNTINGQFEEWARCQVLRGLERGYDQMVTREYSNVNPIGQSN